MVNIFRWIWVSTLLFTTWNLHSCGAARLCGARYGRGRLRTVLIICGVHTRCRCQSKRRIWLSTFQRGQLPETNGRTMLMPCISGVAIDTPLFSRVGSPLCHRYRLISRTGSHAAFRGTYLRRLRAFIEESDSAVGRRLHCQLAQELAARVVKPTVSPASGHPRSPVSHRIVSRPRRPRRLKGVASPAGEPESNSRITAEMSSVQEWISRYLDSRWRRGPVRFIRRGRLRLNRRSHWHQSRSRRVGERTPAARWTRHRFRQHTSISFIIIG